MTAPLIKQYTTSTVADGYWQDAKGSLVPVNLVREMDRERDTLVSEIVEKAISLSTALSEFKVDSFGDIQAFIDLSAEKYGVKRGGAKGNVTLYSFDGRFKIVRAMSESIAFDERLQAAKALVDDCLKDWTKDASVEIHTIINDAFAVDKVGNVNTARILALRRYEIDDERWQRAMVAIGESATVVGSKSYIRVYERVGDTAEYRPIALSMAGV